MNELLAAELKRAVVLNRVEAATIHRRARAAETIEAIVREARTRDVIAAAAEALRWLAFDAIAAALTWSATGNVLFAAGAAAMLHLFGMCASSLHASGT